MLATLDTTKAQNQQRVSQKLTMPVLAIGGAVSTMDGPAKTMAAAALNVQSLIVPDCRHFAAEEQPEQLLASLIPS